MEKESVLFTPGKIGPLTLRNRTIRQLHLKACARETRLPTCCTITINRLPSAGSV